MDEFEEFSNLIIEPKNEVSGTDKGQENGQAVKKTKKRKVVGEYNFEEFIASCDEAARTETYIKPRTTASGVPTRSASTKKIDRKTITILYKKITNATSDLFMSGIIDFDGQTQLNTAADSILEMLNMPKKNMTDLYNKSIKLNMEITQMRANYTNNMDTTKTNGKRK